MTPSVTNGASADTLQFTDGTYNSYDYLAFDGATQEHANFQMTMPFEWNRGPLQVKFYWRGTTDSTADVLWGINAAAITDGEVLDTQQNTFVTVADTGLSDSSKLSISAPLEFTVANASTDIGDLILFRVMRDADDSGDTYNSNDAHLLGARIQYRERDVAEDQWEG
jgi:hypothetical protein